MGEKIGMLIVIYIYIINNKINYEYKTKYILIKKSRNGIHELDDKIVRKISYSLINGLENLLFYIVSI